MATLAEIRQRMKVREQEEQVLTEPITMEQYKMWNTLKEPHEVITKVDLLSSDRKEISDTLQCPKCDSYNMHHINVEVFDRNEDDLTGEHISLTVKQSHGWGCLNVIPPEHTVDDSMKHNPSSRRTGVSIAFVCEQCHAVIKLGVAQHQGQSRLSWRHYQ